MSPSAMLLRYNRVHEAAHLVRRVLNEPRHFHARRRAAQELLAGPPAAVRLEARDGYAVTSADRIPGLVELLPKLQAFAARKLGALDVPALFARGTADGAPIKPFYFNILTRADVAAMPELVDFAVSDGVLRILAPYYGRLPELSHIAVFASGLGERCTSESVPRGTQRLHVDNYDVRHVKLFCFLSDVTEDDGPLTLLPADGTRRFLRSTGRRLRTSPVSDREFLRHHAVGDLRPITGPAGTVAIVDTSRCLHFGSRCRQDGRRLAFVIHYAMFASYSSTYTPDFHDLNLATSPELRSRITDDRRRALVYRLVAPGA